MTKNKDKIRFILGWLITAAVFSGVGVGVLIWNELKEKGQEPPTNTTQFTINPPPAVASSPISIEEQKKFSSGERYLLLKEVDSSGNISAVKSIIQGTDNFKLGDYPKASQHFQQAINIAPNEPESQIYFNNSLARQKGNPFKLAVVVPVDNNPNSAKEILRGVADAQTEFNQKGLDNRLLEIVIVNDGNDPDISARVAQIIAADPTYSNILGVIGHNSSNASAAGLPLYENAKLSMISPTSTSTKLKGENVFFRTVPSDEAAGRELAAHMIELGLDKVAIFYDSNSSYSTSLKEAFEKRFDGGDRFSQSIDLNDSNIDNRISETIDNFEVEAVALFPSTKTTEKAMKVPKENARLPVNKRLKLFGADALYKSETLTDGGETVKGLILAVPWFARTGGDYASVYAANARKRWKGNVSWRTAMSYDATKAFIEALSKSATRKTVLENLKYVNLPAKETAGYSLQFDGDGERAGEVLLVEVVPGGQGPSGTQFYFQLLE